MVFGFQIPPSFSNTTGDGGIWISNTTDGLNTTDGECQIPPSWYFRIKISFSSLIISLGLPEHLCILGASEIPVI